MRLLGLLGRSVFTIACLIGIAGRPAILRAEEIVVTGQFGAFGEVGDVGQAGGMGGDGSDAVAEAGGDDANHAEARAGRGGSGGRGGMAAGIGFSGGAGGEGGSGANARATVSTVGDARDMEATAIAAGGNGGDGALAGSEFEAAQRQLSGSGGHGGNAVATGELISTAIDAFSGSIDARVRAGAGHGGRSPLTVGTSEGRELGGNGGNAVARLTLIGNGEDIDAGVSAVGGSGGDGVAQLGRGLGGSGVSQVTIDQRGARGSIDLRSGAHAGNAGAFSSTSDAMSSVDIQSDAVARTKVYDFTTVGSGSSTFDGGSSSSTVRAVNTSTGWLEIESRSNAGTGRIGGEATARIHGEALGSVARIRATQIHGASLGQDELGHGLSGRDNVMMDAATGRALNLELTQEARAGWGANGFRTGANGGAGGEARTALRRLGLEENDQGIEISTTSTAGQGGVGFGSGFRGGRGGDAWVEGVVEDATGPVLVRVIGSAGRGGGGQSGAEAGLGGDVRFGRVFGSSSNGSSVAVGASANGGDGGEVRGFYDGAGTIGGDGKDVEMIDLVDGRTTGQLVLGQGVSGGLGGQGDLAGGDGGAAFTSITRTLDNESAIVNVRAAGGSGGAARTGEDGDGGQAISKLHIISSGGDLRLGANAGSGDGRTTGEAQVDVYGRTDGDAHSLEIGSQFPYATALGGDSVYGGDARGRFVGEATGNSRVSVTGRAIGGGGALDGLVASDGHDAISYAEGSNAGDAPVLVRSFATGGGGKTTDRSIYGRAGDGGNAKATAYGQSSGGGDVTVLAAQTGGRGGSGYSRGESNGRGAPSIMVDAVRGSTTGRLILEQVSTGGGIYQGLTGGEAYSSLNAENAAGGSLEATSEAVGGIGGGVATAVIKAVDHQGSNTIARARATGGGGGENGQAGATASVKAKGVSTAGGDVQVVATATGGSGFGLAAGGDIDLLNTVSGSTAGVLTLEQEAIGGDSGRRSYLAVAPRGGAAVSTVEAQNLGGGDLRLHSRAEGGQAALGFRSGPGPGGQATSFARGLGMGQGQVFVSDVAQGGASGGVGGLANSRAEASSSGSLGVEVYSEAVGGASILLDGVAGDAVSTANGFAAQGPARVFASARGGDHITRSQFLGNPAELNRNTRARAFAFAEGLVSSAESTAAGRGGFVGEPELIVSSLARAGGDGRLSSEASAGIDARTAFASKAQSAAAIDGVHAREGEWTRIGLQLNARETGPDIMLRAEGRLDTDLRISSLAGLHLSFLDYQQSGVDFSGLNFRIEDRTTSLLDRVFSSAEDARAFFASTIDLGDLRPDYTVHGLRLRIVLEGLSVAAEGRIATYFAIGTVAIPEPGTALLISLGLVWLSARRVDGRDRKPN